MGLWQIELFGEVRATHGERVVSHFRTRKTTALLAYLAYHNQRAHAREALIDLLWPGASPEAGRNGLSRELSSLRSQLELPGVASGSVVIANRSTVQLNPATATTDVRRFEQCLKSETLAPDESARRLGEAVALYRSDLLASIDDDWVVHERARLKVAYLAAARDLAARLERAGDRPRAIDTLHRALAIDPLSEETHRDLARQLAASGDPRAALRILEELEGALERELDAPASPETRALAREIRAALQGTRAPVPAPARSAAATPANAPSVATGTEREAGRESERAAGRDRLRGTLTLLAVDAHCVAVEVVRKYSGTWLDAASEPRVLAFARATDALGCAFAALGPGAAGAALDTGELERTRRDSREALVERAQRLRACAAPGQILLSEETAVLVRHDLDAGARLEDLGVFRLDSSPEPVRLFEALRGEKQLPTNPLNARRLFERPLPLELSRFFGRAHEVDVLREQLTPGKTRLLTLLGPGGVGKTRLALQVLPGLTEPYRGAVAFVPLGDQIDSHQILTTISDRLGVAQRPGADLLEAVVSALPTPSLLVLDNFEQLVESGAAVVRTLLERAPGLTCLVTSRQRLGLAGERELALAPLPVPAPGDTPEGLARLASVQIFLDRAQAVRPDASLESLDAGAVGELVRRLEGIPLALTLAAGRTQILSPTEILARLAQRLDLLATRDRDVPARHRTLRAAIDSSFTLLPARLQTLFAQLSVFKSDFSVEAASALTDEPLVLDDLAELCECSLVARDASNHRYRMLETLREFADEQLVGVDRERVRRRHAEHFLAAAEDVARRLAAHETGPGLEWFARDYENLKTAIAWARGQGEGEIALRLALAISPLWRNRGPVLDGCEIVSGILDHDKTPTRRRAEALVLLAGLSFTQCDIPAARRNVEAGLALYRELGDREGIAAALMNLGIVARNQADLPLARAVSEESLAIMRDLGKTSHIAFALGNLAELAGHMGDHARALAYWEESLGLARAAGNQRVQALALQDMSHTLLLLGHLERARAAADESLALARACGATAMVGLALAARGMVDGYAGDLATARARLEESCAIFEQMSDKSHAVNFRLSLAQWSILSGDAARAERELAVAVALVPHDPAGAKGLVRFQGDIARLRDDPATARASYTESLERGRASGSVAELVASLEGLSWVERRDGDLEKSARWLGAASGLRARFGTPTWPQERPALERERDALVSALGADAFQAAFARGQALGRDEILRLALSQLQQIPISDDAGVGP